MNQRIVKIKNHLVENKVAYFTGAGGIVIGAAVGVFVCGNPTVVDSQKLNAVINWKSPMTKISQITLELPARGHRGNILFCNETHKFFQVREKPLEQWELIQVLFLHISMENI